MEDSFDSVMDNLIIEHSGVLGAICADDKGLCLAVRGNANSSISGTVANIAKAASQLEPDNEEHPVITFESNNMQCMIQKNELSTLAIFKNPQATSTN